MTITALPTPPSRANPTTFSAQADALLNALPTFVTECNETAAAMNLNSTTSTSTTSLTVGTGAKTLTVETAKSYQVGMYVIIARTSVPTTWMHGVVTAYNAGSGSLSVTVDLVSGSGTITDWTITLSAPTQLSSFASGAELLAGTEAGKSIAPDVMKANVNSIVSNASVRQTVLAGPVGTDGLPTFLATVAGLNLTTQNISSTAPLVISAANGANTGGEVNNIGISTANITWSSLSNTKTYYLYVTVAADGTLTTGFTELAPIYQWGGNPATTSGQATFNIQEMKMYMGNGATAPQANIVFVGECTTSGGNVSAVVMYAYNGKYDSGYTATLPNTATVVSKNHNIGTTLITTGFRIKCTSAEGNFAVNDVVPAFGNGNSYCTPIIPIITSAKAMQIVSGSNGFIYMDKTAGTMSPTTYLTTNKWSYEMYARREF